MVKNKRFFKCSLCLLLFTTGCATELTSYETNKVKMIERDQQPSRKISKVKFFNDDYQRVIEIKSVDRSLIEFEIDAIEKNVQVNINDDTEAFPNLYSKVDGILTFRGNHLRGAPSFGRISSSETYKLEKSWSFRTGTSPRWGGGSGWTGQPSIVRWPNEVKEIMNIDKAFKEKESFIEVVYASLDGHVYFLDLDTGEKTRNPINIGNPIKGSLAIDPRGYPLLYVGDGIEQKAEFSQRIFSLIDHTELYTLKGNDGFAFRKWGAFDSSPLINRLTDTLVGAGENGLFYKTKLNTEFDLEKGTISVNPKPLKYRYKVKGNSYQGIENSVAVYGNFAFFADNGGSVQGLDLTTMKPFFALAPLDDTDATIGIDQSSDNVYLYTATEVDNGAKDGYAYIRKLNALTGEVVWKVKYPAFYYDGVNGGVLASPIIGKEKISDIVIFTIARYKQRNSGLMVALNKETGEEVWSWEMPYYAWSSPVDVYDLSGEAYIVQCDSAGNVYFIEAATGKLVDKINLGTNIESSPAVYENSIVVGTRGGNFHRIDIKSK